EDLAPGRRVCRHVAVLRQIPRLRGATAVPGHAPVGSLVETVRRGSEKVVTVTGIDKQIVEGDADEGRAGDTPPSRPAIGRGEQPGGADVGVGLERNIALASPGKHTRRVRRVERERTDGK